MLVKLLSNEDKKVFLAIAELLSLSDKPLLWDGKPISEATLGSDTGKLCIQKGEKEQDLLAGWRGNDTLQFTLDSTQRSISKDSIENQLIENLSGIPLQKLESPEVRAEAAVATLRKINKELSADLPSVPKLIIFELMLLALSDGHISSVEYRVIDEVRAHYKVEDFIFKDLLERAESSWKEYQKTLAIILE